MTLFVKTTKFTKKQKTNFVILKLLKIHRVKCRGNERKNMENYVFQIFIEEHVLLIVCYGNILY